MKKITLSLVSTMVLSGLSYAGGDIAPVVEEIPVIIADNSAFYVGLGYGYFNQSIDDIAVTGATNVELDTNSIFLQAGYQYNQYIAVEGRYWFGISDISQSGGQHSGDHSGDLNAWGIYLKPMYPVTENVDIYALLGYADTSVEYDTGEYWDTDGFSWGIGAQYSITENILIFADYLNLGMPSDFDYDPVNLNVDADINLYTFNVGVSYKF
jgi:opacity protein-like surface antigen